MLLFHLQCLVLYIKCLLIIQNLIIHLQEKVKGKNKLVPRLFGINKESVVRVDEKTKEIMKTWPLTTVRRWAASPNSFTLVSHPTLTLVRLKKYHMLLFWLSLPYLAMDSSTIFQAPPQAAYFL